jgi:excisionase family DNA binding protein
MLTTRQAAQRIGLTREQLFRRIERGEIAARFDGTRWLVDPRACDAFLASHRSLDAARDRTSPNKPEPAP